MAGHTVLVITHLSADFDAAASAYAASLLHLPGVAVLPGSPNRNVRDFINLHSDVINFVPERSVKPSSVRKIVVTDTCEHERTGPKFSRLLRSGQVEAVVYDHHTNEKPDFPVTECHIEPVGSTTTILVEKLLERGVNISPAEATLFALGIHEDTGSLTFKTTHRRDAAVLARLYELGASPDMIYRFLHTPFTREQTGLLTELLNRAVHLKSGGTRALFASVRTPGYVEGASSIVHRLMDIYNSDLVVVAFEHDEKITLIMRSRSPALNCLELASCYQPGGHPEAAVAVIDGEKTGKVIEYLIQEYRARTESSQKVADFMSKYVLTVEPSTPIRKVAELSRLHGHSGFPVVEKGKLVGIITRSEIDKAEIHNLSHAPVRGFMIQNIKTVSPDDLVSTAMEILQNEGVGRLPVVSDGELVGIITRTDILKALQDSDYYTSSLRLKSAELVSRFETFVEPEAREVIRMAGFIADELGYRAYVVGGLVRDLILGQKNPDIDIVIEGSAIRVAEKIAESTGADIDTYEQFDTAVLIFNNGLRIDFASTRTEYYETPGALPQVRKSGIYADLSRRDFSINAIAMSISRKDFGALVDVVGGLKDIEKGIIRVLHSLSFIEDPTRILRGIRFARKFGFTMDRATESLAAEAISMGMIRKAAGVRMRDELIDIINEDTVIECFDEMQQLGIFKEFNKNLSFTRHKRTLILNYLRSEKDRSQRLFPLIAVLLYDIDSREARNLLTTLKFRRRDIDIIFEHIRLLTSLRAISRMSDVSLYFFLRNFSRRSVENVSLLLPGNLKSCRRLKQYLEHLSRVNPELSGEDLKKLGFPESPLIGRVKDEIIKQKLLGNLKSREDEIKFARQFLEVSRY